MPSGIKWTHEKAEAIMLKAGLQPLEPYKKTSAQWKCKHIACGAVVFPRLDGVLNGQGGCRPCGYKAKIQPYKVSPKDAIALMIKNGFEPQEPYISYQSPWKCKCSTCGNIVYPSYGNQKTKKRKCEFCARNKVDPKVAIAIMKKAQVQPLEPYKNFNSRWKCKCLKCGRIVYPSWDTVNAGKGACRYCAKYGINYNVPSYIYLITHNQLNAHKVGFGNHKKREDRLQRFNKKGWDTYKVWQMDSGGQAVDIEKEIFRIIRKELKIPSYLTKADMPQTGGQAETMDADLITLLQLEKIIKKVIKGYRINL